MKRPPQPNTTSRQRQQHRGSAEHRQLGPQPDRDTVTRPTFRGTVSSIPATHNSATPAISANASRQPTTPPNTVAAGTPTRFATVSPRNSQPTPDARRVGPAEIGGDERRDAEERAVRQPAEKPRREQGPKPGAIAAVTPSVDQRLATLQR